MTETQRLKIIFAGSGEFGEPTLSALMQQHDIVQVITQPDRPAGRGRALTPTPVAQCASQSQLPLLRTDNINTESLPPADLMIVIAFGQKIAPHIVDYPRLGSMNLHASLLPKYRGAAPINWAIINGETITGNSVIRLAQKMDAGKILAFQKTDIGETETAGELHDRLAQLGPGLVEWIIKTLNDDIGKEQDESLATLAPKLTRKDTLLDWSDNARNIANRIRGLYPWPGCRARLLDKSGAEKARLTLARAKLATAPQSTPPGTIQADGSISTADGAIEILDLQPEGKRLMSLAEFRNGHPWDPGMRIESIA